MSHWARAAVNATAGQALAMQFAAAYEKDEHVCAHMLNCMQLLHKISLTLCIEACCQPADFTNKSTVLLYTHVAHLSDNMSTSKNCL